MLALKNHRQIATGKCLGNGMARTEWPGAQSLCLIVLTKQACGFPLFKVEKALHIANTASITWPRSWDRPLYAFRGGFKGAGASSTDSKIAANIERGF